MAIKSKILLKPNGVCAMNTELTLAPNFNPQTEIRQKPDTRKPWNKGKLVGQKPPLKLKEVWEIRIRLQLGKRLRELALFNLVIDRLGRSTHPGPPKGVI
jgi:hypothetical protein